MSTRARRKRELIRREGCILNSARDAIREDGLLNLRMTRIAEKCEYAVGTIYQHFSTKEDLLVAIVTENSLHRMELFQRLASWKVSTRDRMLGMVVSDMLYANHFPEHFLLEQYVQTEMVWNTASKERRQMALAACEPLADIASAIVHEAVKNGELKPHHSHVMEIVLPIWALTTGARILSRLHGVAERYDLQDTYRLMLRHQQTFLNGLNWLPLVDLCDAATLDTKISIIQRDLFHD